MIVTEEEPRAELEKLLSSLKARLLWHREYGGVLPFIYRAESSLIDPMQREDRSFREGPTGSLPREEKLPVMEGPIHPVAALESLEEVRKDLGACRRCRLASLRRNLVFGEGNPRAEVVFVGEAPGGDEDREGRPFVGPAGQLLTRIINAMGLKREDVYICNILKCRPPGNRDPEPAEIAACEPFLIRQLQAISPRMICALGTFAATTLLKKDVPITALRGRFHDYRGIRVMPTFHPAYLLRNSAAKKQVWEDVQLIMKELGAGRG